MDVILIVTSDIISFILGAITMSLLIACSKDE